LLFSVLAWFLAGDWGERTVLQQYLPQFLNCFSGCPVFRWITASAIRHALRSMRRRITPRYGTLMSVCLHACVFSADLRASVYRTCACE
jgi:hypothetical protein